MQWWLGLRQENRGLKPPFWVFRPHRTPAPNIFVFQWSGIFSWNGPLKACWTVVLFPSQFHQPIMYSFILFLTYLRQGTSIEPCVNLSMETSQAHNSVSSAHSLTPVCWDGKCGTYMQHGYPFLMGKGLLCLNNHSYLPCYQHSPLSIWAIWSIPLVPEVLGNTTST